MEKPFVVIMAGGIGSRFWPASKTTFPKQFLDILGSGESLIQLTYQRFLQLTDPERILVVTSTEYRSLVQEHLPELPEQNILCEPARKNTAPAVALASVHIRARDPEAVMVVAPSDHVILKESAFICALKRGISFCKDHDALLTLGIKPTRPDTGYGYIEYEADKEAEPGIFHVASFREKPDLETASQYLETGRFVWNAGIFVWSCSSILLALTRYAPSVLSPFELVVGDGELQTVDLVTVYEQVPSISIDYAVMEHARNIFTLPADIGWSDLGTWTSLYEHLSSEKAQNIVLGCTAYLRETQNCLINVKQGKQAIIRGLDDFIVVDSGDALLIYPKSKEQEIKNDLRQLPKQ